MVNNFRVDSTMSINYDDDDCPQNHVSRELRTAAGKKKIVDACFIVC